MILYQQYCISNTSFPHFPEAIHCDDREISLGSFVDVEVTSRGRLPVNKIQISCRFDHITWGDLHCATPVR